MDYKLLLVEKNNGIVTVTINNEKSLNALNATLMAELADAFTAINKDQAVDVVILTGAGRSFVAGADISEMAPLNAAQGALWGQVGMKTFRIIETLRQPVIAAVNGFALGGGCEISMACDIRIASTQAKFGQPEVGLGITPGFGGTQRLARLVGMGKAKQLIYTAEIIPAQEAYRIGLVDELAEPEELMDKAVAMAKNIQKNAKLAVQYAKQAINTGMQTDIDSGMTIEEHVFGLCFATEDQKEGMQAFLEKRKANFKSC
ncbi:3-hydroxybutyryl-CoA dehydratase [Peptostreptococcaceae bacterium oral taxon 113 str. W5053]|nr:3-hydroxybutyryl-CoA dehydratase [Peptostreptococcaceae bacterium oral taxon 113 str. W5053]